MTIASLAGSIGKGVVAGFAGTVAMTASSTIEAKIRGRAASTAPADAAVKVLGIADFDTTSAKERFSTGVHWFYGTGWGVVRGMANELGFSPAAASIAHLAAVWGSAQVMLPSLDVAPPITKWEGKEIAIDLWHHIVYVAAAGMAYEWLESRS